MEEKEFEIAGWLFGGYNKKQTEIYIQELQKMIEETQGELEAARTESTDLKQNLTEAENCYKVLWERSKGQEEIIKAQEVSIKQQKKVIEDQKDTIIKQEQIVEELLNKAPGIPTEQLEQAVKKQFKKLKKKQKKKER